MPSYVADTKYEAGRSNGASKSLMRGFFSFRTGSGKDFGGVSSCFSDSVLGFGVAKYWSSLFLLISLAVSQLIFSLLPKNVRDKSLTKTHILTKLLYFMQTELNHCYAMLGRSP